MDRFHFARRPGKLLLSLITVTLIIGVWGRFFSLLADLAVEPSVLASPQKELEGRKVTCLTGHFDASCMEMLGRWFLEETGAVVQCVVAEPSELLKKAVCAIPGHDLSPDVMVFPYPLLPRLVEEGVLADLTDFIKEEAPVLQPEDFLPNLYKAHSLYRGRNWALPFDGSTQVLYFRKSLLQKHGLRPPRTWDEYTRVSRFITEKERGGGVYGTAIMAEESCWCGAASTTNRFMACGIKPFDEGGAPTIDSPIALKALTDLLEQSAFALPLPGETGWAVVRDAFLSGRVAMAEGWTGLCFLMADRTISLVADDWGVVPLPLCTGEGRDRPYATLNQGFSVGVSSKTHDMIAAQAFLSFVTRPDVMRRLVMAHSGVTPTRMSVLGYEREMGIPQEALAVIRRAVEQSEVWPETPHMPELMEILAHNIDMALEGRKTPVQALGSTASCWCEVLSEPLRFGTEGGFRNSCMFGETAKRKLSCMSHSRMCRAACGPQKTPTIP